MVYRIQAPAALTFHMMLNTDLILLCSGSNSFKEQSAQHVAPVKNILENHASYLMSGKELSKLVAFVKGTQFDLVVRKAGVFLLHMMSYYKAISSFLMTMCVAGISSKRKIWMCSLGELFFRA